MAKSIYSTPVSEVYGESTALATTVAYGDILNVRKGFKGLQFYCSAAFKFLTTPRIDKVLLYDHSAKAYKDQTLVATDNTTAAVNLGTMTVSDILYVGAVGTYLGLSVDVGTVNAVIATFTEEYSSPGGWTALPATISDGTLNGGNVTLAQDGLYTWGLPTNWVPVSVNGSAPLYFTRFYPTATLTANTSLITLITINKGTNYAYYAACANNEHPYELNYDEDLVGGLQFLAGASTPTVYVNHIKYKG